MNEYIILDQLLIKLAALAGLSLLVERLLTFLNTVINRLLVFQYSSRNTPVEKLKNELIFDRRAIKEDEIIRRQHRKDEDPEEVVFNPSLSEEEKRSSAFDLLLIRPLNQIVSDRQRYRKYRENNNIRKDFWMQIIGSLVAIILCLIMQFSVWDFFAFAATGEFPEDPAFFGFIFTGIIIGSGSKPINFLMNFVVNRKIEVDRDEVREEAKVLPDGEEEAPCWEKPSPGQQAPPDMEVQPLSIEERVGFEYDGGDRPGRLENTHRYTTDVDLVVYHHTAMHCDAPFEEVVKEFDRKGWLTGYHCVVFPDGTIRVLCRWDRFANHALPHNPHSFGLAFQGNFETNPGVPFSNPDGSLGIQSPTQAQLKAAARVVAMYTLMHGLTLDFHRSFLDGEEAKGIVPHNAVAAKACPGNNFPLREFEQRVQTFYEEWKDDDGFNKALQAFRQKPMVTFKTA